MIVYNPNRDITEDRPYPEDYSMKMYNTVLTRTKLVINMFDFIIQSDTWIFQFFYPRFSMCCWASIQIFIYFFDMQYLLTYVILGLIWIVLAFSPFWKRNITPILRKIFFSKQHMHPLLKGGAGINILKSDDINYVRSLNSLIDNDESGDVIA